jgi:hypothetical protein
VHWSGTHCFTHPAGDIWQGFELHRIVLGDNKKFRIFLSGNFFDI